MLHFLRQIFSRRRFALLLAAVAALGCAPKERPDAPAESRSPSVIRVETISTPIPSPTPKNRLKYIFLFIGDGMGPCQVQTVNQALAKTGEQLSFTTFPIHGELSTGNWEGKVTDSAAAATALSTGQKTENGRLGQDKDGVGLVTISEILHQQGMQTGILTTVALDHATPAGFYAHTEKRTNYDEITRQLFQSGFDYFAGGGFHGKDAEALAEEHGYLIARGEEAGNAAPPEKKLVCVASSLKSDFGMEMAADGQVDGRNGLLARNLARGINRLTGDAGFFMMIEGGRIDVAGHYHDGGDLYWEVLDFDLAVREAVAFYEQHPGETLVLVTADHETGGLTAGEGDPSVLSRQSVSCDRFDEVNVAAYRKNKVSFQDALPEITAAFGLTGLTTQEEDYLKTAYAHTLKNDLNAKKLVAQYGYYEAVSSAAANLVAERAGIAFTTGLHTGVNVDVFALGVGQERFSGVQENTAVHDLLAELVETYGGSDSEGIKE